MEQLLAEQKRTNKLLQTLIYAGLGFVFSLVVLQVGMHLQLFI
jgi:ubiquinone biosynthesis protein